MNEVRLRRRWRMSVCIAGIVTLLLVPFGLKGQTAVSPPPALLLGAAWYPEQWPESRWEADLTLMEQAGVRMVRVGEFRSEERRVGKECRVRRGRNTLGEYAVYN